MLSPGPFATPGDINQAEERLFEYRLYINVLRGRLIRELHPAPQTPLNPLNRDSWKTFAIEAAYLRDTLTAMIDAIDAH